MTGVVVGNFGSSARRSLVSELRRIRCTNWWWRELMVVGVLGLVRWFCDYREGRTCTHTLSIVPDLVVGV